jgi:hypothetical protein
MQFLSPNLSVYSTRNVFLLGLEASLHVGLGIFQQLYQHESQPYQTSQFH